MKSNVEAEREQAAHPRPPPPPAEAERQQACRSGPRVAHPALQRLPLPLPGQRIRSAFEDSEDTVPVSTLPDFHVEVNPGPFPVMLSSHVPTGTRNVT